MTQVTESDYRIAQHGDARVRQEFLDAVDFGEDRSLFTEVNYQEYPKNTDTIMQYYGLKETITVYPSSFKKNFQLFMSTLRTHEVHHARQNKYGLLFNFNLPRERVFGDFTYLECLIEIPAYTAQLLEENFKLGLLDKSNLKFVRKIFADFSRDFSRKKQRDWKSDLSRVLCPSPYDDAVRERYEL